MHKFNVSWVCQDGHCYVSSEGQGEFTIRLNFPNSDELISKKIESLVKDINMDDAAAASQLGCHFELQIYCAFSCTEKLMIAYSEPAESVTLTVNLCSAKPFSTLVEGVLYKLDHQHPAIDFVGLLKGNNQALYLLMVQASVSLYVYHKAKLFHLDKQYDKYDEFKSTTVLDYYKSLCPSDHQVIYIYVSPQEKNIPTSLKKHLTECKLNLKLGCICEGSESCISRTLSNFRLKIGKL